MKVSAAFISNVFGGTTATATKDGDPGFKAVLSGVTDSNVAPTTDLASTPPKTSDSKPVETGNVDLNLPDLAAWSIVTSSSNGRVTNPAREATDSPVDKDGGTDTSDEDNIDTTNDQTTSVSPNADLLALVQIAALVPQQISAALVVAAPIVAAPIVANTTAAAVKGSDTPMPGQVETASLLVKAAPDPLISDVKFETHLAPVQSAASKFDRTKPDSIANNATVPDATGPVATKGDITTVDKTRIDASGSPTPTGRNAEVPTTAANATIATTLASETVNPEAETEVVRVGADTSVASDRVTARSDGSRPAAGSADDQKTVASDPGQGPLTPTANADAQAGPSDDRSKSDTGRPQSPVSSDPNTSDVPAIFETQVNTSMIVPQRPVLSPPVRAVAEAVTSLAAQPATPTPNTLAPARTMVLQLSPAGLGTVSVRLHLTGRTLDVSLNASDARTASLLDHERAVLTNALGDRDYQLNSLVIQGGDATSAPGGSSASTDPSGSRPASQATADQQGGGAGRGSPRDPPSRRTDPDRGAAPAVVRGDDLFV